MGLTSHWWEFMAPFLVFVSYYYTSSLSCFTFPSSSLLPFITEWLVAVCPSQ
jgi:hypothetical protein